jgi:oligoendopeptidase F
MLMEYTADIKKMERHYVPKEFSITDWNSLEPYFKDLAERNILSVSDLEKWLRDMSELEAVVNEDACWRQIRMTCDTESKDLENAFNYFYLEIQPKIQPYADLLNRMLLSNPFVNELDQRKYFTYLREVKKNIELFREENIPLQAEMSVLQQRYGMITGKMTVEVEGREYTLQQASKFLEGSDRNLREQVYHKINGRRIEDKIVLDELFSKLVEKRNQVALNAGFTNYGDYKFTELGRFDYTKEDCFKFHEAIRVHILPLVNEIYERKREKLGVEKLRPWDTEAEPDGLQPLRPFSGGEELLDKTITCFTRLRPFFGECLRKMSSLHHLDLESRKGKAPGGYNMPLAESGAPFIFMNAAGQMHDVTTMVHEGGHAVHSFLAHGLELNAFKEYPMEIAEVASMAMELFSMDHWDVFFNNEEDLKRAKRRQLERAITIFPWIATIDKFQHWLYENPNHSLEDRRDSWVRIQNEYTSPVIDHSGLDKYRQYSWQKQLHLYEVPFYYIEYGIAQLGAFGIWNQYLENPGQALDNYMKALSLGGTRTLPELYESAGLSFDFSSDRVEKLISGVRTELGKLEKYH